MECIKQQIVTALTVLGVKGTVRITQAGFHRYAVYINDSYFGIFDIDTNTFVIKIITKLAKFY